MLPNSLSRTLLALLAVGATAQRCSRDVAIDNFSRFADRVNSLGEATNDDGSMLSISAANNVLTFTPATDSSSYYYETFPCQAAQSQNLGGFGFTISYPAGSSFSVEIQYKSNCNDANYQSEWFQIDGLSGTAQQVTLDLNVFPNANKNAIVGFVFAGFTDNTRAWTLRDLKFTCGALLKRSIGFQA